MYLHTLWYVAIFYITSSGKSLGCGEVNLNLISGNALAEIPSNYPNLTPGLFLSLNISVKPSEFWCPADSELSTVDMSW
jgi:hypothetical protein